MAAILDFCPFGGHKVIKTRKVHAEFQFPSMYGVQINVPFVCFEKSQLEVCTPQAYSNYSQTPIFKN